MPKTFHLEGNATSPVTELVQAEEKLREIEERYRALFDGSLDCVFINDFNGNFLDANQASLDLLGYQREDISKLTFASLLTEDQLPLAFQTIEEIKTTGCQKLPTEYRLCGRDGRQVHVETQSSLIYRDGKPFAIQGIARDLTRRKLLEQELRTSEADLAEGQRVAKLGNWHYHIASNKVRWSDELYRIFGIEKTPFSGTHESFLNCVHPDDRSRVLQVNADATAKGTTFQVEYRIQTAAGDLKTIREIGYAVKDDGGKVVSLYGTAQDITEQKQAEAILRENEVKFHQLAENISEVFWICSNDFNTIHYVSPAYELIWGRSPESLYANAHEWFEAIHPEERQRVLAAFTGLRGEKPQVDIEYRITRPDGSVRWIHDRGFKICDAAGNVVRLTGIASDITERKSTDEKLRKLSRAVDQSPASIVITNLQGEIEYVNPKFTQTCGYSADEVFGKNSRILKSNNLSPSTYREMWDTITGGREWHGEFQSKKKNGELFWESASISPIRDQDGSITHFLVVKEDITEKKSLERQFLRAQRMENLGTLASGVAHDLNNILSPILMSTDYLRAIAKSADDHEILNLLHDGACRGADIVRQLLIFGRGLEGERSELQVRTLLKETAKIMKQTFPKNISLETLFPPDLWTIRADPTQIHQVVLNLCINARDAMPSGGRLRLAAENRVLTDVVAGQIQGARPGQNVVLSVTDTGSGIAPEILDQIFDPFFTTKEPGKGTGLGLSTVLGIVKGHGGCVQVQSRQGEGTRFEIYLPALEGGGSAEVCTNVQPATRAKGQFILLVDDEEAIRVAGRRMLEIAGYQVLIASNAAEGIVEYSKRRSDIRAVVTDIMMPVMDGASLIRVLRQISPEVRIIAMSGLPPQPDDSKSSRLPVDAFVPKPFEAARLIETLHEVLNSDEKKSPPTSV